MSYMKWRRRPLWQVTGSLEAGLVTMGDEILAMEVGSTAMGVDMLLKEVESDPMGVEILPMGVEFNVNVHCWLGDMVGSNTD